MSSNTIDWAITANDSAFRGVMRNVIDTLTGVKRGADTTKASIKDLGETSNNAAGLWNKQRRELEALYTTMGKVPSKEVVAELDKIEEKYRSLAKAAESGNQSAAQAMRGLLSQARSTVARDTMADDGPGVGDRLREKTLGAATSGLRTAVAGLGAAFTAAAIGTRIKEQIDLADALDDSAQKASVSAQSLSTLAYAVKFGSVDLPTLTSALGKLSKTMFDADTGNKKAAATFQALGISIRDQEGNLRASDEVLLDLAERFAAMPEGAQKSALAMEVFGKSGADLLPVLNMGKDGIEELREEARKLGLEVSNETAAAAGELNDRLDKLYSRAEGVWRQFASRLIPTLSAASDGFDGAAGKSELLNAAITAVDVTLKTLIISGAGVGAAFRDIGNVIGSVAAAAMAAARGDFQMARNIIGLMTDDMKKNGQEFEEYAKRVWNGQSAGPSGAPRPQKAVDAAPIRNASGGSGAKSRASEWESELDQMKLAHQRMTAQEGTFTEFSRERERDFWKGKLDTVKMSNEERMTVEKKYLAALQSINNEAFNVSIAESRNQMAAMEKNYAGQLAIAEKIAQRMQQAYGADSKQFLDAQQTVLNLQKQAATQREQLEDLMLADKRAAQIQAIALAQQQTEQEYQLGLITRAQLLQQEMAYQDQLYEINRQALERKRELADPDKDPVAHQQVLNQLLEQERAYQVAKSKQQFELQREEGTAGGVFSTFESSFASAADGMLNRAQGWRQSMVSIFTSTGSAFIQEMAIKPTAAFLAAMARRLLLTSTTTATETTMEASAAGAKMAASSSASAVQVANNAVVAGTGAAASQAPIPFVGPALAAVAMGAMLAMVMGMSGSLRSARNGFDIPAGINPLTQLHEQEMVLPKPYANVIRSLADRPLGEGSGAAPEAAPVFAPNIQALDARGVDRVLEVHGRRFFEHFKQYKRNI